MKQYIVELEPGVWVAEMEGDPGRTLVRDNAQRFDDMASAAAAIKDARTYRLFENATIVDDEDML